MEQSNSLPPTNRLNPRRLLLKSIVTATSIVAMAAVTDCAMPTSVHVDLKYPQASDSGVPSPPPTAPPCALFLTAVSDERSDKSYLGEFGAIPVEGTGVEAWVRSAVKTSLASKSVTVVETAPAPDDALQLNVEVLKVYASTINTATQGAVVLRVDYRRGATDLGQQVYRGQSTPFFSGLGSALNEALRRASEKLANDVSSRCAKS